MKEIKNEKEVNAMGRGRVGNRGGTGRGRMGGPKAGGPSGYCVCPSCGHREAHGVGVACYQKKCPQCGNQMIRE